MRSSAKGWVVAERIRTACSSSFPVGITTRRSTSLPGSGLPYAYEPKRMIRWGWNRSTISLAIRWITLSEISPESTRFTIAPQPGLPLRTARF